MKIAYIKSNVEASGYVIHGLGLLSAIAKQYGHESKFANIAINRELPGDVDAVAITACSDAFPLAVAAAQALDRTCAYCDRQAVRWVKERAICNESRCLDYAQQGVAPPS